MNTDSTELNGKQERGKQRVIRTVNVACAAVRRIGRLAKGRSYKLNSEEVQKIFATLDSEVEAVERLFHADKEPKGPLFTL
jgi:hypothetical protein